MTLTYKIAAVVGAFGLTACGGTSSVFSDADEARRTFADPDGDLVTILQDGGTLSSRAGTSAGIQLRFDGGDTNLSAAEVSISRNANGELTATLNGQSREFTLSDRITEPGGEIFGYEFEAEDGTTFSLFHFGGEIDDLLSGDNGFGTVVQVAADLGPENDTLFNRAFAAVGGETTDAYLETATGTTTYTAFGRFDMYPQTDFENSSSDRVRLRGEVTMEADFDTGMIGGTMDELTLQMPGEDRADIDGTITFNDAAFTQNTFSGSFEGDAALETSGVTFNDDANFNGAFFGPAAEEVHGVMSATGTVDGTDMNTIGFFTQ